MNRFDRGMNALEHIHGTAGKEVYEALSRFDDDFARQMIEQIGDVFTRPGADLKLRLAANLGALVAQQSSQLKVHIHAALNVGLTRAEVKELIMQMVLYCGYPACIAALRTAEEAFAERAK